mmetsp:Transcript_1528/g.3386  ORF Transcript_1528/g.3386 Transcript_1528/m.3386 type:complete len:291 (-) Transcript_1528:1970-2842(-)
MLRRFKGRSAQTERMQRKPDKEGYKLYALCDKKTAFVYDFFPSGRLEKTEVKQQVEKLVNTLPGKESIDYIIAMDNFFTTPKVIESLREKRVGIVGTARRRRGWNPFDEERNEKEFNSLYLDHDKRNFLIARWVDNSEVLMVSTVHTGEHVVDSHRKRPRETHYNREHVRSLFGTEGEKTIEIPKIIDDYNNWMGGVDLSNQLISQYKPQFRCRRTWMPLFLQAQDIVRMNSYVAAKALGYQDIELEPLLLLQQHKGNHRESTTTTTNERGWVKGSLVWWSIDLKRVYMF